MRAFVFPGQGSQKVGMGAQLAEASAAAREVFEEVDDALGQKLFRIMQEGPEDALTLTENAQPAIMAHAIAVLRVLEKEGGITLADKAAGSAMPCLMAARSGSATFPIRTIPRRNAILPAYSLTTGW